MDRRIAGRAAALVLCVVFGIGAIAVWQAGRPDPAVKSPAPLASVTARDAAAAATSPVPDAPAVLDASPAPRDRVTASLGGKPKAPAVTPSPSSPSVVPTNPPSDPAKPPVDPEDPPADPDDPPADPDDPPAEPEDPPLPAGIEPPAPPAAPGAVVGVACASGNMTDRVSFQPPANGGPVTTYTLLQAASAEGPFEPIATAGSDARGFSWSVETTGTPFYRVAASGPGGSGPVSAFVTNDHVLITATVGSAGALLRSSNGEIKLELAPGSFSKATDVTVSEIDGSPTGGLLSLAGMYEISPSGALGAPARLSVNYTINVAHFQVAEAMLAEAALMTYASGEGWISGATNVRAENGFLSGDVSHFSHWTGAVLQPHGTSATTYCSDGTFCHNLTTYPGASVRFESRASQVCFNCHGAEEPEAAPGGATGDNVEASFTGPGIVSKHPVATGDLYCTICHDAHTDPASSPSMLRSTDAVTGVYVQGGSGHGPGDAYCWTCHGPSRNRRVDYLVSGYWTRTLGDHRTGYGTSAHGTLTSDTGVTCTLCHEEHGSAYDNLLGGRLSGSTAGTVSTDLATGAYADACLRCHDGGAWAAEDAANIKQFVTAGAERTDTLAGGGHRIKSAGGTLPVNAPLPCDSCHGPHGSKRGNATLLSDVLGANLKTTSATDVRKFCLSCHSTSDLFGWDSTAGAYAAVSGSATVQGLLRNGGANGSGPNGVGYNWLRLKSVAGHARADANSCYECHGNDYSSDEAANVHNPGSYSAELHTAAPANASITVKGVSYGPLACSGCHNLELGPLHDEATASSGAADCSACHPSPRNTLAPWSKGCTQSGCHTAGSTAPMHQNIDAKHNAPVVTCTTGANCHNAASGLAALHVNAAVVVGGQTRTSCAVCHAGGVPTTADCATCHGFTEHPPHVVSGACSAANCHSTDAMTIHGQAGGPGCDACHALGKTPSFSCGACHTAVHTAANHGTAESCASCHSTGNLMGVHGDKCNSCHPTPAQGKVYAGNCTMSGCHSAATLHNGIAGYGGPGHHTNHGEGDDCFGCHGHSECQPCHNDVYERGKPTTTSNARASYTAAAVINLSATDAGEWGYASGVMATYYQIDGGPVQAGRTVSVPGPATGTKKHSVEFWSIDNVRNTEAPHKVAYFSVDAGTDTNPPTGTMSVNNGAEWSTSTWVTVNSSVTDAETGIAAVRIDPGTGTFGAWTDYAPELWVLTTGQGTKTIRVEYKDGGGRILALSDIIKVDSLPPAGTVAINNGAVATNNLSVTLNSGVTDTGSGLAEMRTMDGATYIWGAWQPYSASAAYTLSAGGTGNRSAYVQYRDVAGNILYIMDSIAYDITLPTGTMSVNNGAAYTSSLNVTINSAVTDAFAGIYQMQFSNDNSTWSSWETYAAVKNWTVPEGDGVKTVWAHYSDRAGNILTLADIINFGTSSDTIPPTGTVAINGGAEWINTTASTLTLSATDTGGSGVFEMRFSNDAGTTWSNWELFNTTRAWTLGPSAGSKTVHVQFRDGSGNISTGTISDSIAFETNRPNGYVTINGGALYTDSQTVTLSVSGGDGMGGSGVTQMQFSNDGSNWSAWEPFGASKTWTLSNGVGGKNVYIQVRDAAGNLSFSSNDFIAYLVQYTLAYSSGANGYITGTTSQTVNYGASGTAMTAVPLGGYRFLGWSDGRTDNPRTDTDVFANVNAAAWFAPAGTYTVQFRTDGTGYVSGGAWIQAVNPGGSTVSVSALPYEANYSFSYWSDGTNYAYTNPLVLTNVNSNQTWTAYFSYSGSCPFLFTWNGAGYTFEADEFAAGYLGLRTSKGYRRPNPLDYHVLATTPAVKDGALEYKLVEERDETDYLDQVKLYAVDAPADREVWVERSQAEGVGQFTTLNKVIHTTLKNLEAPQSVGWVNNNADVRAQVAANDGEYLVLNEDRNAGFNYQTLELDLGDVQSAPMVKLVIDGRTMIPTSQDGRTYSRTFGAQAKLEVQDAAGNWIAVPSTTLILPKPAEFDRPFVLNLTNVWISDSRKVRITYLYKTYIDSILLDTTADVPVTLTELPLESADLAPHGFDFREGIGEWYDYVYGMPFSEPRYELPGNYTKFGSVTPLLGAIDDKFVIFGGGDEITLRFTPPGTAATGTRRFLFLSDGYYKTLKEDIAHTVEPLPFAAMSNFPYAPTESYPTDADHQAYQSEWNTRYESN